jgi:hypothetical protein
MNYFLGIPLPTHDATRIEAFRPGPSKIASDCAGTPLAGRANHEHCGADACDCGRRTVIPVWVRQDTTIRIY